VRQAVAALDDGPRPVALLLPPLAPLRATRSRPQFPQYLGVTFKPYLSEQTPEPWWKRLYACLFLCLLLSGLFAGAVFLQQTGVIGGGPRQSGREGKRAERRARQHAHLFLHKSGRDRWSRQRPGDLRLFRVPQKVAAFAGSHVPVAAHSGATTPTLRSARPSRLAKHRALPPARVFDL